ncbi:glycosyltransferase [Marinobacter sp. Arc7-DN-1]|uniref:glycosyltransferase n=1 Tax=Marinobacter sp. Arc7-DN-1 TaxID=2304594 RepID=UPI000E44D062|nr:glycosyltransferase [Marinobacter sp. Arc7-DN-1]AXS85157.1 glycosyltransferase [Marinobacter sp. Arc7-DN-1]
MEKESPVRILFVIDNFTSPHAGTEGQLLQLIANLPVDRFQPELLLLRSSDYVEAGNMPCKTEVLGGSKLFSITTWLAMFRFARRKKKDGIALCHVFFNDSSVICPPVFSLVGIPTVISRRDMGYWYTGKYLRALRLTARFVRGVVANSEAVKRVTALKEGYSSSRISVIYNGYPVPDSDPSPLPPEERPAVLSALGLPTSGQFVALVANLREIKRIGDAIKAIAKVSEPVPDSHLVLIGAGDQEPYRVLAESLGVADRVHFLGVRSDVRDILRTMDAGLLCSESEGYSNAIVEYMQARLPVIASDVGGNSEAVEHGVTGYLFPRGDITRLAACLEDLLKDQDGLAKAMGEAGYQKAHRRHGLQTMIESHAALYARVVSNRVGLPDVEVR